MPDVASEELVPVGGDLAGPDQRRAALEALNEAAEAANDPGDVQEIMVKGRLLGEWLAKMRAPLEESRLAGKASVVAGRRLGLMLEGMDSKPVKLAGLAGTAPSERGRVVRELGLEPHLAGDLRRLARVPDADFQRYIQINDRIPSLAGALKSCIGRSRVYDKERARGSWKQERRRRAGIRSPRNPSFDEGLSLLRASIGHLSASFSGGSPKKKVAVSAAMDLLYEAEDLLRPYSGGYVE